MCGSRWGFGEESQKSGSDWFFLIVCTHSFYTKPGIFLTILAIFLINTFRIILHTYCLQIYFPNIFFNLRLQFGQLKLVATATERDREAKLKSDDEFGGVKLPILWQSVERMCKMAETMHARRKLFLIPNLSPQTLRKIIKRVFSSAKNHQQAIKCEKIRMQIESASFWCYCHYTYTLAKTAGAECEDLYLNTWHVSMVLLVLTDFRPVDIWTCFCSGRLPTGPELLGCGGCKTPKEKLGKGAKLPQRGGAGMLELRNVLRIEVESPFSQNKILETFYFREKKANIF